MINHCFLYLYTFLAGLLKALVKCALPFPNEIDVDYLNSIDTSMGEKLDWKKIENIIDIVSKVKVKMNVHFQ